jgi:hypothetical protein
MATATLLAATPSDDSKRGRLDAWEAFAALRPACSHPATEHDEPPSLTQASPTQPELRRHSSRIYVVLSPNTGTNTPHSLSEHLH